MLFNKNPLAAVAALAALPSSFAQLSTVCNPLNVTCPNGLGLSTSSYFMDFTKQKALPSDWTSALYEYTTFNSTMGAVFNFGKQGDSPTIYSNFFFFFGHIEYVAQVAPGKGIVSSMVLLSDDLDEIDWEFTGTNTAQAQTNYFGKGVLNYGVSEYVSVASPQTGFHNYAIDWSPTEIVWSIDGEVVRTLNAAQAGNEFPQTPMKVSLGLWDGGDASKQGVDTVQWAGGATPLPPTQNYTSYIKSVNITNANPAMQYEYTDRSGSYKSIKAINNTVNASSMASSSMVSSSMKPTTTVIPEMTVLSTSELVITACASSVLNCPARSTPITSEVLVTSNKPATTMVVTPSSSVMAVSASTQSSSIMSSSVTAKSTVASVISEVVYTTVTSCPVATTKVANGTTSVMNVTSLSTILSTSTSTLCTKCVAPQMTNSTVSPAMTNLTAASMSTVAAFTTEIVYTTLTSCPVTSTKIANGTTAVLKTTSVSTILSTSTSTICTKCVAPQMTSSSSSSMVQNPATAMPPSIAANAYNAYTAAHACTGSTAVPGFTPPVPSTVHNTIVSTMVNASSTITSSTVMTSVVWAYPAKTTTSTTYMTLYSTGVKTVTDGESSVYVSSTVVPTVVASTVVAPVAAPAPTSTTSLTSYSTIYSSVINTMTDSASSTYLATSAIPSIVSSVVVAPVAAPTTTIASTIYSTIYSTSISTMVDSASSTYLATTLIPSVVSTVTMVTPVTSTAYTTVQDTVVSTVTDSASSTSLSTAVIPSVLFSAVPAASPSSSLADVNPVNGLPAVAPTGNTTTTLSSTSIMTATSTSTAYLNGTVAGTGVAASSGFPITTAKAQPFVGGAADLAPAGFGGLAVAAFVVLFL
ncbi:MAG: hypothetical protein ALECFALPRED_007811 [Alectoria fallacina]|uniref:chitinase n=1 Tax=Alectoria fallacina TaxID=1903189 RepID=A0A8H3PEH9_9LECA|nr:MAG: hypothetical protein ALECFALPRED_007811 [Alectoria fallacina]